MEKIIEIDIEPYMERIIKYNSRLLEELSK